MYSKGYYDIHAHILPGVDDGSSSMEETVNMLKLAIQQEIKTIIATPHFNTRKSNVPPEELQRVRDEVEREAKKLDNEFSILLGNELFYSDSVINALNKKEALTLNGTRYVLVEFSFGEKYKAIYQGLGNLIRSGYVPILAHVERYSCLSRSEELIGEIIELGCYIQMNCNSLKGGLFHSKSTENRKLVNNGMIHFLGSDCHDQKIRVPNMKSTVEALYKKCDNKIIDSIVVENPRLLLENIMI